MAARLALWVLVGMLAAAPAAAVVEQGDDVDASWLARVQQGLAEKEYRASPNDQGLQAPNRRHNLRTYFDADGIRVMDRTAEGSPELLQLKLSGIGRGDALAPVAPGEVTSEGGRVEIRRPGLIEWYVNSSAGLEQGFTIEKRPVGDGALRLALAVSGSEARLAGGVVRLRTATGRNLAYDHLVVNDATGRTVPARLAVPAPDVVQIEVDDAGATYPLTVDPLLTETADGQLESDQADARMGWSVGGAGDVNGDGYGDVIVGAHRYDAGQTNEGAAFVFYGSASGIGDADPGSADVQIESDQAGAILGYSVNGAGDVNGDGYGDVIVGANGYDSGSGTWEGAAFVFLGSAGGIVGTNPGSAHAQLESDQAGAQLGISVAGAGDVNGDGYADVIAGAPVYDVGLFDEGAAFVFLGSAGGIVGTNPGSAHAQLESDLSGSRLGTTVDGAGDVNGDGYDDVITGARLYVNGQTSEGAAWVFLGSAGGIVGTNPGTAHAQIESNQVGAALGDSVAGAGDVNGDGYADVIVGAPFYDKTKLGDGAAWIFHGSASGITGSDPTTADSEISSDQGDGHLGYVAGAGDVNGDGYADVIIGANDYDAGQSDEGAAFVFLGSPSGVTAVDPTGAFAQLESNQADAEMGWSVAGAGDVNGDGYADVIVGAPRFDAGETDEGAAFLFLGSAGGVVGTNPGTAHAQLESDQASADLGSSVAGAGDVNGDGYGDVIVGARNYDAGESNEGAAFVFLGSAGGIVGTDPGTAHAQLESDQAGADMGTSVAGAGDVNGDGYADVIVGADSYDAGESNEGAAFVFLGSAGGIVGNDPGTAHAQLESDQASADLGSSVAGAGDVNGDGYADVIVGARLYDAGATDEGAAFVFLGSAGGIVGNDPGTAHAQLEMDWSGAGASDVAGAGDVNGDGYADVIVGSACFPLILPGCDGAAFVYHGSASGISSVNPGSADAIIDNDQFGSLLGASVAGAGDVNGDGYADVIVGAPLYEVGSIDHGAAFVFLGSASGVADSEPSTAHAQLVSTQSDAFLGNSVAGAGDVNGDGYADVIVGADSYSSGESEEGAAFVYYAVGGKIGRSVLAQQLRGGGDTTPVEPWGVSHDADDFQVRMTATHPEGRGRVKLEVEACETGIAFGDVSCISHVSSTWTDVTATSGGVSLTETVGGLSDQTLYRWRARVLHASFSVTEAGITAPPNPSHGPWRRLQGQAREADIAIGDDGDGDSVLDAVEDGGPNGGDANGDGTADSQQAEVASLPAPVSGDYIALEASGGCSTLLDVLVLAEDQLPADDPSFDYPHGLVEFEAPCESATVELWFHGATALSAPYRKYGPTTPGVPATTAWYTLPGAVFGTDVIDGNTVATVTLTLADNALGDDTGDDGTILDIGGPIAVPEPDAMLGLGACLAGLFLLNRRRQRRERCSDLATGFKSSWPLRRAGRRADSNR